MHRVWNVITGYTLLLRFVNKPHDIVFYYKMGLHNQRASQKTPIRPAKAPHARTCFYFLTSECLCEVLIFSAMLLFNIDVYKLRYPGRVSNQKYLSWQNQLSIHFHWEMTAQTIYRGGQTKIFSPCITQGNEWEISAKTFPTFLRASCLENFSQNCWNLPQLKGLFVFF